MSKSCFFLEQVMCPFPFCLPCPYSYQRPNPIPALLVRLAFPRETPHLMMTCIVEGAGWILWLGLLLLTRRWSVWAALKLTPTLCCEGGRAKGEAFREGPPRLVLAAFEVVFAYPTPALTEPVGRIYVNPLAPHQAAQ